MKNVYPIEVEEPQTDFNFRPGNWYECLRSGSSSFTEGKGYLCCDSSSETCLVDNLGKALFTKTLLSCFRPI